MGLGLLILVSVGKENLYLSAQPEITFFKIAYRRYTNFSIEPTPQYFKTTPDFGRRCTVNISKNADLMSTTYLYVELPDITFENFSSVSSIVNKFKWDRKIGLALINFIEFEIGGTVVDRHYGDWMNIWLELTNGLGIRNGYNKMIGNITELVQLSQTKKSTILYVPLTFWFCQDTGLALPLMALAHNEIKIHVDFNDINNCYSTSPSYYLTVTNNFCLLNKDELFYQNNQNTKIIGKFIYFDVQTQRIYYDPIKGKFTVPTVLNDPNLKLIGTETQFELNIQPSTVIVKDENFFIYNQPSLINAYLIVDYIYLDTFERFNFINNSHEYLITVVDSLPEQIISSANVTYKLPFVNPVKLIVWRGQLIANKQTNDLFNYTTFPYTETEENIITSHLVVTNSINRMNLDSTEYYTYVPKYQYELSGEQNGIYMYSCSLGPKDLQPSGSMNFSKLDDAFLQLKINKVVNYQNPVIIRAYSIQYNLFRISGGIGGLGFNL
jgi:hypothetical protein